MKGNYRLFLRCSSVNKNLDNAKFGSLSQPKEPSTALAVGEWVTNGF
jgi:hypothetical protein